MKNNKVKQIIVSSVACAAAIAQGQTTTPATGDAIQPVQLETVKPPSRNRLSVSYRMGLNITADFKKLGGLAAQSNPNPHANPLHDNASIRTYDQGAFVGEDSTGNDHGPGFENTTWNWGYQNPDSARGNTLVVSSSSSPATAVSKDNSDDPQHGVEIGYSREFFRKNNWRFGLESALGYMRLNMKDSRTLTAVENRTTDTYTAPGSVTLPDPYSGSTAPDNYSGPGAVINVDPINRSESTIVSSANTIVGDRELEANIYSLRLGPYAEVPLNDRFSLLLGGGLYLAVGDTHFSFNETVTLDGVGAETHRGSGSHTDFLVGGYIGGAVEYALTDDIGLFVGAQFQTAGRSVNRANGKESVLNMSESMVVSIGASYSF